MTEEQKGAGNDWQEVKTEVKEAAGQAMEGAQEIIKEVKEKYDAASPETQAKVKKGLVGAGIAVLGLIGLRKLFRRK